MVCTFSTDNSMYLTLISLPFFSYFTTNCFGRFIGFKGSSFLAPVAVALTFSLSIIAFFETTIYSSPCLVYLCVWFSGELLLSNWSFLFDSLASLMLLVITGVSCLVHLYSTEYMANDPHLSRFLGYLSLFTFFMLLLVTADNFIVMFLGWEGIGLASFLLISFWSNRIQAGKSAVKAMLVNRVGDIGLAIGICYIFLTFKTVDYCLVFSLVSLVSDKQVDILGFSTSITTVITLLLLWGAIGKSAQIGLHIWLPDAMEGPTPVSALIHAATLVTAGVFLLIRCSSLFESTDTTLTVVTLVGSITSLFAATIGLVQNDLKRVIAFSTCSQLGYMVFAIGLSNYSVALFHLANHAVFKALLFLSSGCIIHGMNDEQDLRRFGGVISLFPISYVMILIGSLALVGFPFLTGFYSKDVILELAASKHTSSSNIAHSLGCLAAFCTAFYSFRLAFLTFTNKSNSSRIVVLSGHEGSIKLTLPLMVLGAGSLVVGYMNKDLIIGLGSLTFQSSILILPDNATIIDSEFLSPFIKNIPLFCTLLGIFLSWLITNTNSILSKEIILQYKIETMLKEFYVYFSKKWHADQLVNEVLVHRSLNFGYRVSFQLLDKGIIESVGPKGIVSKALNTSRLMSILNSGFLYQSSLIFVATICFVIWYWPIFSLLYSSVCLDFIAFLITYCILYL